LVSRLVVGVVPVPFKNADRGVLVGVQAAWWYSWMSPPSTSFRSTGLPRVQLTR
jgi:hypothetical protein